MEFSQDPGDMAQRLVIAIRQKFGGARTTVSLLVLALIIAALWILFTGLFQVSEDAVAVIQRFGKYNRQVSPGLQFKLPDGIEKYTTVPVKQTQKEEFGFRTLRAGVQTRYADERRYLDESLMLTGDLNCAIVPWIVQYRIGDPVKYLFRVRDVNGTLRDMAEATMRKVIGDRSINEVLTERLPIADQAKQRLQKALDEAETGLSIVNVELKNTNVPEPVESSFNEVNQALQEKEKMIYEAREAYNKVIPAAKGEAQKTVSQAEGYALDRVNKARGDSSRFVALYQEYARSRNVTRRRLYLETIKDVLPKLGSKYVIDEEQDGVLPLLNLDGKGGAR